MPDPREFLKRAREEREGAGGDRERLFSGAQRLFESPTVDQEKELLFSGARRLRRADIDVDYPEPHETTFGRFTRGVGRGIVHPVRAFLNTEDRDDLGGVGMAGEFVGAGLTFVPLYKKASIALKGVGLLKQGVALGARNTFLGPLGMTPAGVRGAQIARGALAFAGFETFAGDSPAEAPIRFVRGLAEGAAFEGAAIKVAQKWRARSRRKWTPTEREPHSTPIAGESQAFTDPLALKLENWIRVFGQEDPGLLGLKSGAITEPLDQLSDSFARIVRFGMPEGQAILPGLTQRDITRLAKTVDELFESVPRPGTTFLHTRAGFKKKVLAEQPSIQLVPFRRIKGEDLFDVWVIDRGRGVWRDFPVGKGRTVYPALSEIMETTSRYFKELGYAFPDELGGALGKYYPHHQIATAKNDPYLSTVIGVSNLLHEVVHHLSRVLTVQRKGHINQFDLNLSDYIEAGRRDAKGRFIKASTDTDTVKAELIEASARIRARYYRLIDGLPEDEALKRGRESVAGDPGYYHTPHELVSRMSELIMMDPRVARDVAPNATALVGNWIEKQAPLLRHLMSKEANAMLNIQQDLWRRYGTDRVIFQQRSPLPTPEAIREFAKNGWAPGMTVYKNGRAFEFIGEVSVSKPGETKKFSALIRDLDLGVESVVPFTSLQRPLIQHVVKQQEDAIGLVRSALNAKPEFLPLNVALGGPDVGKETVTRMALYVLRYEEITTSLRKWFNDLPENIRDELHRQFGSLEIVELPDMSRVTSHLPQDILEKALELTGKPGIIFNDNGFRYVYIPRTQRGGMLAGDVTESAAFGARVSGFVDSPVHTVDIDDFLRYTLRMEGVTEGSLDYYLDLAKRTLGKQLRDLADPDVKQLDSNVTAGLKQASSEPLPTSKGPVQTALDLDGPDNIFARASLEHDRLASGRIEVRDAQTKTVLGRFADEDQALDYAREFSYDNVGPDLGNFPGATAHGGGGLPPKHGHPIVSSPSPQSPKEVKGFVQRMTDAQTLFAPVFSALENFAKAAERRGFGPAYTEIYVPAHNAMLDVHRELSEVVRSGLGGLTFKDKLGQIGDLMVRIPRRRHALITGHVEAVTKQEIEKAGGLMMRAMTQNELRVAKFIEGVGLENDVPRLLAINRLATNRLKGGLEKEVERMRRIELTDEAQHVVSMFEAMPKFKTRDEIFDFLGLTAEERQVLKVINDSLKADKDKFSIYAVSRYASAPALRKGFKDGKAQYAFDNRMTDREKAVSQLVSETLEAGFADAGLDPKRHLSGYWPHMRKWVQNGFVPDRRWLPDDVMEWAPLRYRSGELNVYETDPLSTVYRHLRGLYMKRHFDPIMPDVNKALAGLRANDARIYNTMHEYVMELMGRPHASFDQLQGALARTIKTMTGKDVPDRLATDIITGISASISSAVIPFRPALIARNFFESMLKVSPRVGMGYYMKGLRYVVDRDTRKEAFKAAMDAGAIRPGTQKIRSLHVAEELFGPSSPAITQKYLRIFDKGFEWYQSADDWGRAIAHHAQRMRYQDNVGDLVRQRIGIDEFLARAKVNTYDPLDVQIVRQYAEAGDHQRAVNHLGQVLSRETMTRYGYADHPAGWHSVPGRLFGQFGTWPVQYKDYVLQGLSRGSSKDRIEFAMTHGAVTGGTIMFGGLIGVNMQNWTGMSFYTGGPMADVTIDVVRSISGSDAEKQLARSNLYGQVPILGWMATGNPRSVFLPGSYVIGDLLNAGEALQDDELYEAVMSGLGMRVLRPGQNRPLEWIYGGL